MGVFKTALYVIIISILVQQVPKWLKPKLPKNIKGHAAPGWNKVAEAFRNLLDSGIENGGSIAVYYKGNQVVRMAGGYADPEAEVPWELDTVSPYASSTKLTIAVVMAILVDRGLIEYDRPVKDYWPEFAQNGKEEITVEQIISHQAGLTVIDEPYSYFDLSTNPDKVVRILAAQKPNWKPGTAHGYHGITIGLYADQLVRRVDPKRRSLSKFFDEEVAKPFGIDFFIGLPLEEFHRCARVQPASLLSSETFRSLGRLKLIYAMMKSDSMIHKMFHNPPELLTPGLMMNPKMMSIPVASFAGYGTGQSLAKLGSILATGGKSKDKELISPQTLSKISEGLATGVDLVVLQNLTWGRGIVVFDKRLPQTTTLYGHGGMGGQVAFVDPTHQLSWAYLTNHHAIGLMADDQRIEAIEQAIYEVLATK